LKARDEDRQKRDDEINQRLKELEDDNAALQGRLKSEQLDAAMKLKNKDSAIELLQKELAQLKKEQRERDADPDGLSSLQEQVEGLKEELETAQSELEEIQQQNKMLQEEVGDTKLVNQEMKTWVQTLQDATTEQKAEIELQKRKVEEWQKKSGEWSDKAHLWKEKAEMWEKTAKFLDSDGKSEDDTTQADPQALFLAAALEKKRASEPNESRPGWRTMGSIFKKASKADEESHSARIEELEVENTKQSVEIKTLKSEIVQLQSAFKDQIYSKDQEMEELQREYEALESKNENLRKELELARKLNQSIEGESWT
jgi:predicted RNase H-like nuclease (RuvC/YqgF family)